ncbi:MAG TPA: SdpI family protein [Tepidiformaceae bacterium]|nr:SdpI family protein [Tepidiformaceae bacterium]
MGIEISILIVVGIVVAVLGLFGLLGKLPPNHIAGIRTRYSLASDQNWYATQRAGSPWLIFGGIAIAMAGLAFVPFVFAGKLSQVPATIVTIALVVLLVITGIGAWIFGEWGARHDVLGPGLPKQ